MCKQADVGTLLKLCLVSFGMLELAGTVLYRHIVITTVDGLYRLLAQVRLQSTLFVLFSSRIQKLIVAPAVSRRLSHLESR